MGGLFAVAYAVHLANNKDLSKVKFAYDKLREHFANYLRKKMLELFPVEKTSSTIGDK